MQIFLSSKKKKKLNSTTFTCRHVNSLDIKYFHTTRENKHLCFWHTKNAISFRFLSLSLSSFIFYPYYPLFMLTMTGMCISYVHCKIISVHQFVCSFASISHRSLNLYRFIFIFPDFFFRHNTLLIFFFVFFVISMNKHDIEVILINHRYHLPQIYSNKIFYWICII